MLIRAALACACIALAAQARDAQDGAALYQKNCAGCHDSGASRVPSRQALKRLSPERILLALESGTMMMMGARRTAPELHANAASLAAKSSVTEPVAVDRRLAPRRRQERRWQTVDPDRG